LLFGLSLTHSFRFPGKLFFKWVNVRENPLPGFKCPYFESVSHESICAGQAMHESRDLFLGFIRENCNRFWKVISLSYGAGDSNLPARFVYRGLEMSIKPIDRK
jgi:hypothetical protein